MDLLFLMFSLIKEEEISIIGALILITFFSLKSSDCSQFGRGYTNIR